LSIPWHETKTPPLTTGMMQHSLSRRNIDA